jgi:hypothetical protein
LLPPPPPPPPPHTKGPSRIARTASQTVCGVQVITAVMRSIPGLLVRWRLRRPCLIAEAALSIGTLEPVPKKRVVPLRPGCCSSPESSGYRGAARGSAIPHLGRSLSGASTAPRTLRSRRARPDAHTSAPYTLCGTGGGDSPSGPQSGTATNHGGTVGTEKTSGADTSMRAYYRTPRLLPYARVILNTTARAHNYYLRASLPTPFLNSGLVRVKVRVRT